MCLCPLHPKKGEKQILGRDWLGNVLFYTSKYNRHNGKTLHTNKGKCFLIIITYIIY